MTPYRKEYYLKNKERIKRQIKEYKSRNKEKIKAYYFKNKEHIREYYLKNRDHIEKRRKERDLENRDKLTRQKREWSLKNSERVKEYYLKNKYVGFIELRSNKRVMLHLRFNMGHWKNLKSTIYFLLIKICFFLNYNIIAAHVIT